MVEVMSNDASLEAVLENLENGPRWHKFEGRKRKVHNMKELSNGCLMIHHFRGVSKSMKSASKGQIVKAMDCRCII